MIQACEIAHSGIAPSGKVRLSTDEAGPRAGRQTAKGWRTG